MKRGDIFIAEKKFRTKETALHPIIFWAEYNDDTFIGMMITHGKNDIFPDNIPLNETKYYSMMDSDFSDTYVVGQALVKKNEWGSNFKKKIGTLSSEGLKLVENEIINNGTPKWWSEYLKK